MVLNSTNAFTWNDVLGFLKDIVFKFGPKLIIACIILYVGFKVIRFLCKRISILFEKRNLDPSLRPFLMSINSIGLKVLLILTVVGYLGIEMTQFTAIIASAGVAIGLALSGTLQNVATFQSGRLYLRSGIRRYGKEHTNLPYHFGNNRQQSGNYSKWSIVFGKHNKLYPDGDKEN